jgi:hypothetical protein
MNGEGWLHTQLQNLPVILCPGNQDRSNNRCGAKKLLLLHKNESYAPLAGNAMNV